MKKRILTIALSSIMVMGAIFSASAAEQIDLQDDAVSKHMKLLESFAKTRGVTQYPDYYAGAYLSDDNELVVLMKESEMDKRNALPIEAIVEPAKYSMNELLEADRIIDAYFDEGSSAASGITLYGILEDENMVFIALENLTGENEKAILDELSGSVDFEMLKFQEAKRMVNTSANLGGGIYWEEGTRQHHISIGFRAQKVINGVAYNGFVTSGHGMVLNVVIYDADGSRIGTSKSISYGGTVDATFVHADSQSVPSTTAADYSIVGNHYVTGFTTGATVVSEGNGSGRRSGKIKSTSVSGTDDRGIKFNDYVWTEYSSVEGDSGGIAYMTVNGDRVPAGITVGSANPGSVLCKIQNIIDVTSVIPY